MFSAPIQTVPNATVNTIPDQQNPALAKAESQLRRAWNLLPPWKKQSLVNAQDDWNRVYDNSSDEAKLSVIRDRTLYLLNEGNKK
jgi:hypothetical protein